MLRFDGDLCLVTDRGGRSEKNFLACLEEAIEAGVTWVQFREKAGLSDRKTYELGLAVRQITHRCGVPLVVDDRLDLAMAIDADGVHLGQSDLPLAVAKKLWRPDRLYGVSVAKSEEALEARNDGADYLGIGAVFPTQSKSDAVLIDTQDFDQLVTASSLPVIAIGGIHQDNVGSLIQKGCVGVAVISAVWGSQNVGEAVRNLRREIRDSRSVQIADKTNYGRWKE